MSKLVLNEDLFEPFELFGPDNSVEEIADVEIMIIQLKIIFNLGEIDNWREYKLTRLKDRINNE